MAIEKCAFKDNQFCHLDQTNIKDIEIRNSCICEKTCPWMTTTYTGKDKRSILFEQFNRMKQEKEEDVLMEKFIAGHCEQTANDFDSICYEAATMALVYKKSKELEPWEFLSGVDMLRLMKINVPKSLKRKYFRIKKNSEKYDDDFYNFYKINIADFSESIKD